MRIETLQIEVSSKVEENAQFRRAGLGHNFKGQEWKWGKHRQDEVFSGVLSNSNSRERENRAWLLK